MQNQSLLTNLSKTVIVEQTYASPSLYLKGAPQPYTSIYCFLSTVTPWANNTVPAPQQSQKAEKQLFKNMFVAKEVTTNNLSGVIERIDWTVGQVYQAYDDNIDMYKVDENNFLVNKFYIKNSYDQIFKCLWNSNGAPVQDEPYFQPGSYGTNGIFLGPNDGYKWKFMYTIDPGSKQQFMDDTWIPVPIGLNNPNPLISAAGTGSIDVINVINGGSNYDPANSPISIVVTGDGSGATAQISSVVDGAIQDIVVLTPGSNYSYANAVVVSANGSGAILSAPSSPIGGHGNDPISELGCSHVMITCSFNGSEETSGVNIIPTTIKYYQMGIVISPTSVSLSPKNANGAIYKTSTGLVVASSPDTGFISDEIIYQGTSLANATFTATVLDFDIGTGVVDVINTVGTPITNASLYGNTSKVTRTLLSTNTPDYVPSSGYLIYVENLSGIQRSTDGIEQFRIVLGH
jgi:hypothetical protein